MEIDERTRQELYGRLDDMLGKPASDVLMAHLPPVGWADVATKTHVDLRFESLEHRLEAQFERALRVTVTALVAAMIASVGAAVGITQLLAG